MEKDFGNALIVLIDALSELHTKLGNNNNLLMIVRGIGKDFPFGFLDDVENLIRIFLESEVDDRSSVKNPVINLISSMRLLPCELTPKEIEIQKKCKELLGSAVETYRQVVKPPLRIYKKNRKYNIGDSDKTLFTLKLGVIVRFHLRLVCNDFSRERLSATSDEKESLTKKDDVSSKEKILKSVNESYKIFFRALLKASRLYYHRRTNDQFLRSLGLILKGSYDLFSSVNKEVRILSLEKENLGPLNDAIFLMLRDMDFQMREELRFFLDQSKELIEIMKDCGGDDGFKNCPSTFFYANLVSNLLLSRSMSHFKKMVEVRDQMCHPEGEALVTDTKLTADAPKSGDLSVDLKEKENKKELDEFFNKIQKELMEMVTVREVSCIVRIIHWFLNLILPLSNKPKEILWNRQAAITNASKIYGCVSNDGNIESKEKKRQLASQLRDSLLAQNSPFQQRVFLGFNNIKRPSTRIGALLTG
jgi:hypothetical protein